MIINDIILINCLLSNISDKSDIVGFDDDCFCQQIRLHSLVSKILPHAGILESSKRSGSLLIIIAIHINCTRMQSLHKLDGSVDIGSDYSCSKSIRKSIGSVYHVFLFAPFQYAHHWSENLLFCDLHMILNVDENGWFDEISFLAQSASSSNNLRSFLYSFSDVIENALKLLLADDSSQLSVFIQWISHFQTLGIFNASLHKFIVD